MESLPLGLKQLIYREWQVQEQRLEIKNKRLFKQSVEYNNVEQLLTVLDLVKVKKRAVLWATANDSYECLELLIQKGYPKHDKATLLAAEYGLTNCLKLLLDNDFPVHPDALIVASKYGHAECVKLLMNRCTINHNYALSCALEGQHDECIRLLDINLFHQKRDLMGLRVMLMLSID